MDKLHQSLMEKSSAYRKWHEDRDYHLKHWAIFIAAAVVALVSLTNLINRQIITVALLQTRAATTITAASCNQADVQTAVNSAQDGDTVQIPAGTCTWTTGLKISSGRSITLSGAGIDQTIITDETTRFAIDLTAVSGKSYRITGFTIKRGTVVKTSTKAVVNLAGTTTSMKVDHNKFDHSLSTSTTEAVAVKVSGNVIGVIDHNTFLFGTGTMNGNLTIYMDAWGGGVYGDVAWTEPARWGTSLFMFVEDNTFTGLSAASWPIGDSQYGARIVYRFNQMTNANGGAALHGSESGGRARAPRAIENYHNTYSTTGTVNGGSHRGGALMAFNNSFTNFSGLWGVRNHRSAQDFGVWQSSDGSNPFDLNDGVVYASGTHTGSNGSLTLTDSTKSWTTNQWSEGGYSVRNTTKAEGSFIVSNTATTITVSTGEGGSPVFDTGDSYQILRATKVFDAMGRGAGVLISGNPPVLPTGATWVQQEDEPSYQWNNTVNGKLARLGGVAVKSEDDFTNLSDFITPHVIDNRDVFQHKTGFNGAEGVGAGPIANRPSTCTAGVAYWATDEGDWNSTNGTTPDGRLYKCTSTNTWTLYYTPYVYPHPLVSGATPPPPPPPPPEDTTPPSVSITSPAGGANVPRASSLAIESSATDNILVSEVKFFINGTLKCTDTSPTQTSIGSLGGQASLFYTCSWNVPGRVGRTYRLQTMATDSSGNFASSGVITVIAK